MLHEAFAYTYGLVTHLRNRLYDTGVLKIHKTSIPVISIGNLTCGGSGKTPLSIFIANELLKYQYKPVLLAKGYKGSIKTIHEVMSSDSFLSVGDEALIMKRNAQCPVFISNNKTAGAQFIDENKLGTIVVLDDGFQHRRLAREVNILCIDASSQDSIEDFLNGLLLPAGPFREHRDAALERANIVVISNRRILEGGMPLDDKIRSILPKGIPVFQSTYKLDLGLSLKDASVLEPCNVVACCTVANPDSVFESFAKLGYTVIESYTFPDHYPKLQERILEIRQIHPDLPILCTEKDAVKLSDAISAGVYYCPLEICISHEMEIPLMGSILNSLQYPSSFPENCCKLIGMNKPLENLENLNIESDRLLLRPLSNSFAEEIFREFSPEITRFMTPSSPKSISEVYDFINLSIKKLSTGQDLTMAILKKDTHEFLGCCGLHGRSDVLHPELGIWIKKAAHGNKYGFEAVRSLKEWAQGNLRYEYLIYPVDRNNIASRKIPEKLGGVIFKEKMDATKWGGVLDEVIYKIDHENSSL